ncbi:hypothetical protein F6Y05_38195 [Bacillus megaterium]|nr:hypothetical protein [Priestia megaterium]
MTPGASVQSFAFGTYRNYQAGGRSVASSAGKSGKQSAKRAVASAVFGKHNMKQYSKISKN